MHSLYRFYLSSDKVVFFSFAINLLLTLIIINLFALFYPDLPTHIPLFYSLPWGNDQLATLPQFSILPFLSVLICLINLILTWHLHDSQVSLKRFLSIFATATTFLLTVTAIKIVFIFI